MMPDRVLLRTNPRHEGIYAGSSFLKGGVDLIWEVVSMKQNEVVTKIPNMRRFQSVSFRATSVLKVSVLLSFAVSFSLSMLGGCVWPHDAKSHRLSKATSMY